MYESGNRYEGDWKNNKKHGIGKMKYINVGEYQGYWENGHRHGEGIFTYANGDVYSGWWRFGNKHGTGTYSFSKNGMKLYGVWEEGNLKVSKWIFPNGTFYQGGFENNKPSGAGEWHFENGNTVKGSFSQKKKEEEEDEDLGEGQVPKPKFDVSWATDTGIAHSAAQINTVEQF